MHQSIRIFTIRFGIILTVFLFVSNEGIAQNLRRKAGLGVAYFPQLPDSIAQKLQYKKGAVVQFALEGSTAAALGIAPNDIITRVNDIAIDIPQHLPKAAKTLRDGDLVQLTVLRGGQEKILSGKAVGRPKETSKTADVVYGEFAYKSGLVRTIYKTPKERKPLGTIYFLQGLPCYSMDNFEEENITKRAIDAMVDRGFAVYRMEKADMGDNLNQAPCETMGFHEELDMYRAGYKHLLTLKEVDANRLFLFGHSMGGISAPLLAQEFQPKGVVVYGTVFKPWMDYMLDAFIIQAQYYGEDLSVLRGLLEQYKPYIYDYFYYNKPTAEIAKNPLGLAALQNILGYSATTGLGASGRSPLVFKEINQLNMAAAWGKTKCHVLAIYGECDIAANNADDHQSLVNFVNKVNPGKATFWQAPGATHMFENIGTMKDFIAWQKNPQAFKEYASANFSYGIFDYACQWMKDILKK